MCLLSAVFNHYTVGIAVDALSIEVIITMNYEL